MPNGKVIAHYPGNKSVKGLYHLIINNIPPHKHYYELFAGSAEIARRKAPAQLNVINDVNKKVYRKLLKYSVQHPELGWNVMNDSVLNFLPLFTDTKKVSKADFIYLDPPYLDCDVYEQGHEYYFHKSILQYLVKLPCNIMISHYEHPVYDELLQIGWRKKTFETYYRRKYVVEAIYMNYPEPEKLHDYSFLGADCWERQLMKRRLNGYLKGLRSLSVVERSRIIEAINKEFTLATTENFTVAAANLLHPGSTAKITVPARAKTKPVVQ